jgi:hypothetical protein
MSRYARIGVAALLRADLSDSAARLLAYLDWRAGRKGVAWPSQDRIASDLHWGERKVRQCVAQLRAAGLLIACRSGFGKSLKYTLGGEAASPAKSCRNGDAQSGGNAPLSPAGMRRSVRRECAAQSGGILPVDPNKLKEQTTKNKLHEPTSKRRAARAPVVFPLALSSDRFREVWSGWMRYRCELHKPLTESTIKQQVALLESFGHDAAIVSIKNSIRNGWQGLFDPRGDTRRNGRGRNGIGTVPKLDEALKPRILR